MPDGTLQSQVTRLRYRVFTINMTISAFVYVVNIILGLLWNASGLELLLWTLMLATNTVLLLRTYQNKFISHREEIIVFSLTTLQISQGFLQGYFLRNQSVAELIAGSGVWFFVIYIFAFFIFSARRALLISMFVSLCSGFITLLGTLRI